ncbi:hypothetical protein D6C98_01016, partial [Aureobasidium pullulans]
HSSIFQVINTQPKGITTLYLVYLSHCNIPRLLHSPRHDSALQGRAVGTSTKAAWLPSVSAERLLSHIPLWSGRLGRTSNTSHVLHKILRGRGLSSFLVKHERSHVPMPRALHTVVFLQPRSPIRVLSLSYILDQITSTRSKNSNCTYPANGS